MFLWILLFWSSLDHSRECSTCSTNRSIFCISLFPGMEKRISLKRTYIWDTAPSSMNYLPVVTKSIWLELRRPHHTHRHDVCTIRKLLPKDRQNTRIVFRFSLYPLCMYYSSHWSHQSHQWRKNRHSFITRIHLANNPHGCNSFCGKKYSLGRSNQNSDSHSNTCSPWLYAFSHPLDYLGFSRLNTNSDTAHQLNTNSYRSLFFKYKIDEFFYSFS